MKMKHTKDYIEVSILLYKEKMGTLSNVEKESLSEWKGNSGNRELYQHLATSVNVENKKAEYDSIDSSKAWNNLESLLVEKKGREHKLFTTFMRYAAVIILPLAIGLFLVYQVMNTQEDYSNAIVEQIVPGTNKATLILADGSTVDLEEQKDTLIAGKALNRDNKLAYKSNKEQLANSTPKWHKLVVPVGGEYKLQLSDGTIVYMNSDSELKYTDRFVGKKRIVQLKGEAYFEVSKNKDRPFIVQTSTMDVRVYGTEFNVMAYEDENLVQTTLAEGSIGIQLKNESGIIQSEMLKPNMQLEYRRGDVKGSVRNVQASLYTGWKDGKFQFNNEKLGSIMRKLSRWYGVNFFTQNQAVQDIRFSGEMKRFDDFETILNLLEYGSDVEFEVVGKTVMARSIHN